MIFTCPGSTETTCKSGSLIALFPNIPRPLRCFSRNHQQIIVAQSSKTEDSGARKAIHLPSQTRSLRCPLPKSLRKAHPSVCNIGKKDRLVRDRSRTQPRCEIPAVVHPLLLFEAFAVQPSLHCHFCQDCMCFNAQRLVTIQ